MFKPKTYYYLIDSLNDRTADILKKALATVSSIVGVNIDVSSGIMIIKAGKDVEVNVKAACNAAGTTLRTKLKKKDLY